MKKTALLLVLLGCAFAATAQTKVPNTGPTIGARDGISYYVSGTSIITKSSSGHCGWNDLLIPNLAKFEEETRVYEQYDNGKFVKSWVKKVETFIDCIQI